MHLNPVYTAQCAAYRTVYNKELDVLPVRNDPVDDLQAGLSSDLVLTDYNDQTTVPTPVVRHYTLADVDIDGKGA